MLERRGPIARARLDDENRVQVDWDELCHAINTSRRLTDTSFVDSYLGFEIAGTM